MRAVVQRVSRATVTADNRIGGTIGPGLLVLVGVGHDDGPGDVQYLAAKLSGLRIFADDAGRMNLSVREAGGAILVVSQFTLYGDCRKGRRPSFDSAAEPSVARTLYEDLVAALRGAGLSVATGEFQSHMAVELLNDGPVTILLDSRKQF